MDERPFDAVLFDMDGVVTDTAAVHAAAWEALFAEYAGTAGEPFDTTGDYRRYVDGRSREDGVRGFLASRFLRIPDGEPTDAAGIATVHGLAARKQQLFADRLRTHGTRAFPSTVALLRRLRAAGIPTALVTASRNSAEVLAAAGLVEAFDAQVNGDDAIRLGLAGKPDPAMFLEAARRLGVPPGRAVVIEDAEAGVRAGAAGQFGLVVGVDRTSHRSALLAAGANVVVTDLSSLDLLHPIDPGRPDWCAGADSSGGPWLIRFSGFDPASEGTREALCTLGNGYWATRGAAPEAAAGGVHYPGTYLAGVYNRLRTVSPGHTSEDEHLVNAPNWLPLAFRTGGGDWFTPEGPGVLEYRQELDMRHGVLSRTVRHADSHGRTTRISSRRIVSLADPRLATMETTFIAEDWSGELEVWSGIDGEVTNGGVADYRMLADHHLRIVNMAEPTQDTVLLDAETTQSGIRIAMAARTTVRGAADVQRAHEARTAGSTGHRIRFTLAAGKPVSVEKVVAVATSRDRAISTPALAAAARVARAPHFAHLLAAHKRAWKALWDRFGVTLGNGERAGLALTLNTFHVLQSLPPADIDAGIPARGLHGEGYRGHVFWDELFVYPMLTLRVPDVTRGLLLYRHRRLEEARAAASTAGFAGAMFPWQSGSDGREETPRELWNARSGRWMRDNSRRQRHVGLAVAYSVWKYYEVTGDVQFLASYGAELLAEVARFVTSLAVHDVPADRYDISGVMGPDEFHDGYPNAPGTGVRNNAYTNVLAAWVLQRAGEAIALVPGCPSRQPVSARERETWDHLSRRLRVPFHDDGVISQFDGYEKLAEFGWDAYRARYGDISRLDLILEAEGDSPNRYRLSKQADVLMLFYLFSAEEIRAILGRLGYEFPPAAIPRTIAFYLARTSHGSTLSRLVQAWVLARSDRHGSWSLLARTLDSDLADVQGGTTREGVHLGAMAGSADLVLRCYSGLDVSGGALRLNPVLPPELAHLRFDIVYRGQPITVRMNSHRVQLRLHAGTAAPIRVRIGDQTRTLRPGDEWSAPINGRAPRSQQGSSPVVSPCPHLSPAERPS